MRSVIVLAVLLLLVSSVFAADKSTGKEPPKRPEAADVKKDAGKELVKDRKTPDWPRPYKPTEEISADSVVPFPADI